MELTTEQRQQLTAVAREIADALETIASGARSKLDGVAPPDPTNVVAVHVNPMTARGRPTAGITRAFAQDREHLLRLLREPFVARVVVSPDSGTGGRTTFYISRASVAGLELAGARLATYTAPLGRLAELAPGATFPLPTASGPQDVTIEESVHVKPVSVDGAWEAEDSTVEFVDWHVVLASLRRLLEQAGLQVPLDEAALPDLLGELLQHKLEADPGLGDVLAYRAVETLLA